MSSQPPPVTVSRRALLGRAGVAAGSVALLGDVAPAGAADPPGIVGPGVVAVRLIVNGTSHDLQIEPNATVADVLRGPLDLTGTKIGCDRGVCSACSVWLDGAPVASCMLLAIDVGTRAVTTIEGLAQGDMMHPLQEAFIAHDAVQCGYCTLGMIMSGAALLQRTPQPGIEQIQAAIEGHLCRCGTYPHVIEAVQAAAAARRG